MQFLLRITLRLFRSDHGNASLKNADTRGYVSASCRHARRESATWKCLQKGLLAGFLSILSLLLQASSDNTPAIKTSNTQSSVQSNAQNSTQTDPQIDAQTDAPVRTDAIEESKSLLNSVTGKGISIIVPEFAPWVVQEDGRHTGILVDVFSIVAESIDLGPYYFVSRGGEIPRLADHTRRSNPDIVFIPHVFLPDKDDESFFNSRNCDHSIVSADFVSVGIKGEVSPESLRDDRKVFHYLIRPLRSETLRQKITGGGRFEEVVASTSSMIKRLLTKRTDVIADDGVGIIMEAEKLGVEDRLVVLERHFVSELRVCVSYDLINQKEPGFLQKLSEAIEDMSNNKALVEQLQLVLKEFHVLALGSHDH